MLAKLLAFTFTMLTMAGCGYSIVPKNSTPFSGSSLHVAMFSNSTYHPEVEGRLRAALVNELAVSSLGELVGEKSADLLLTGDMESLTVENAAFTGVDKAAIYRILLTVQARVTERTNGKVLWQTKETVREEYPASSDMALQRNARDAAIVSACREMARHLVMQMKRAF